MTSFHIMLDEKFDELISNLKKNKLTLNDLVKAKSFICKLYDSNNNDENEYIKECLYKIEFKI